MTIEYDLSNPYDEMAFKRNAKALDMAGVLFEIQYNLRKSLYDDGETGFNAGVDATLNKINDMVANNGIIIDDLTN